LESFLKAVSLSSNPENGWKERFLDGILGHCFGSVSHHNWDLKVPTAHFIPEF